MQEDADSAEYKYVSDVLGDVGVFTDGEESDDMGLTDTFRSRWREEIRSNREVGSPREGVSEHLEVDQSDLTFEEMGDVFEIRAEEKPLGRWESDAALLADISAMGILSETYSQWSELNDRFRLKVVQALRVFLEVCPDCDGPVTLNREEIEFVTDAPGEGGDVVDAYAKVSCEDCGVRLLETQIE